MKRLLLLGFLLWMDVVAAATIGQIHARTPVWLEGLIGVGLIVGLLLGFSGGGNKDKKSAADGWKTTPSKEQKKAVKAEKKAEKELAKAERKAENQSQKTEDVLNEAEEETEGAEKEIEKGEEELNKIVNDFDTKRNEYYSLYSAGKEEEAKNKLKELAIILKEAGMKKEKIEEATIVIKKTAKKVKEQLNTEKKKLNKQNQAGNQVIDTVNKNNNETQDNAQNKNIKEEVQEINDKTQELVDTIEELSDEEEKAATIAELEKKRVEKEEKEIDDLIKRINYCVEQDLKTDKSGELFRLLRVVCERKKDPEYVGHLTIKHLKAELNKINELKEKHENYHQLVRQHIKDWEEKFEIINKEYKEKRNNN